MGSVDGVHPAAAVPTSWTKGADLGIRCPLRTKVMSGFMEQSPHSGQLVAPRRRVMVPDQGPQPPQSLKRASSESITSSGTGSGDMPPSTATESFI